MQQNINPEDKNTPEYRQRTIAAGRYAILMVMIFTVINLVMVLLDRRQYILFSASIPYYATLLAKAFDNGFSAFGWGRNGLYTTAALAVSMVMLAVYLAGWQLGGKKRGWMAAALVLFILDTLALMFITVWLTGSITGNMMELFLHGWAIWHMVSAVNAYKIPTE